MCVRAEQVGSETSSEQRKKKVEGASEGRDGVGLSNHFDIRNHNESPDNLVT
jgi:hypothetical protein